MTNPANPTDLIQDELIERVARAIAVAEDDPAEDYWKDYIAAARAAILALQAAQHRQPKCKSCNGFGYWVVAPGTANEGGQRHPCGACQPAVNLTVGEPSWSTSTSGEAAQHRQEDVAGMVLVPIEPTEAMIDAFFAAEPRVGMRDAVRTCWSAMARAGRAAQHRQEDVELREALEANATALQRFINRIGEPRKDGTARIGAIIGHDEIQFALKATNDARAALDRNHRTEQHD